MKNRVLNIFVYIGLLAWWIFFCNQCNSQESVEEKGVIAQLRIAEGHVIVQWRFLNVPKSPIKYIAGEVDGTPLGSPEWAGYPLPGDRTWTTSLIDITGASRVPQIRRETAHLLALIGQTPPYTHMSVATYGDRVQFIDPKDSDDLIAALTSIEPQKAEPDIEKAIATAVSALASIPAQRRGIYIFTDGHLGPGLVNDLKSGGTNDATTCSQRCASGLVRLAKDKGVSVNFLLVSTDRTVNSALLKGISGATGGEVVSEEDIKTFLRHPYQLLNSGGTAAYSIPLTRRYFWQRNPKVTVRIVSDDDSYFSLSSDLIVPTAGLKDTISHLTLSNPYFIVILISIALILATTVILLKRRRRAQAKSSEHSRRRNVQAVLQDTATGNVYLVQAPEAHIGRAETNEIILDDDTVSRIHATLVQNQRGSFFIENKSGVNGVRVNGRTVEHSELADDDLLNLGRTTLRFTRAPK